MCENCEKFAAKLWAYVEYRIGQKKTRPDLDDLFVHARVCDICSHKLTVASMFLADFDDKVEQAVEQAMEHIKFKIAKQATLN